MFNNFNNPFRRKSLSRKIESRSGIGKTMVFLLAGGFSVFANQDANGQVTITELNPTQTKEYLANHPNAKRVEVGKEKTAIELAKEWAEHVNDGVKPKDAGGGAKLSGFGSQVTGDNEDARKLSNPDFHYTEGDPLQEQHKLLLGKYQSKGVAIGISDGDFEEAYRNRESDPRFDQWAHEYADKVNRPLPPGRVEDYLVIKPLIKLSETERQRVKHEQPENFDLLPFKDAYARADSLGLGIFEWQGNHYTTDENVDLSNTVPGKLPNGFGTGQPIPGGKGGNDGATPDGGRDRMPRGTTTTTKKWVESVKPVGHNSKPKGGSYTGNRTAGGRR